MLRAIDLGHLYQVGHDLHLRVERDRVGHARRDVDGPRCAVVRTL